MDMWIEGRLWLGSLRKRYRSSFVVRRSSFVRRLLVYVVVTDVVVFVGVRCGDLVVTFLTSVLVHWWCWCWWCWCWVVVVAVCS